MSREGRDPLRPRETARAVLFFLFAAVLSTWPMAPRFSTGLPDLFDAKLTAWMFHWDFHQTFRDPLSLFDANIFHPARYALAFSENLYGAALFGFPLYAAGVSTLAASNVLFLLGVSLSGLAAWLLAFAPSVWAEANIQRVYALNAMFLALALLLTLGWRRNRRDRDLVAAAFACGLGASNHLEMGVAGLAIGIFVLATDFRILRRARLVGGCVLAALVGLLPYVYLPLRARAHPLLDWGHPVTPSNFVKVVLRSDFWGRAYIQGPADLLPIFGDYVRSLFVESAWIGAGLALAAIAASIRGGTVVVRGDCAARAGIAMKGGTLLVAGSAGYMAGFMMQKGVIVICGNAGEALADSMYEGVVYVGGEIASLGNDAVTEAPSAEDERMLKTLLATYGMERPARMRKVVSGRRLWNFATSDLDAWRAAL